MVQKVTLLDSGVALSSNLVVCLTLDVPPDSGVQGGMTVPTVEPCIPISFYRCSSLLDVVCRGKRRLEVFDGAFCRRYRDRLSRRHAPWVVLTFGTGS